MNVIDLMLSNHSQDRKFYEYKILAKGKNVGLAQLRLIPSKSDEMPDGFESNIYYDIDEQHQGKGYATEALKQLIALAALHGLVKIVATVNQDNISSIKVIEKNNGKLVATDKTKDGKPVLKYEITVPDFVFHGSPQNNLKIIEPKRTLSKDKYIGDYIFATTNPIYAAMYLIPKGYHQFMEPDLPSPYIVIAADPEEFASKVTGGSIYILPKETFHKSHQKDLGDSEIVSQKNVWPISEQKFNSTIDLLSNMNVPIYFIQKNKYDDFLIHQDTSQLTKYSKS